MSTTAQSPFVIARARFDAVIFDLDGVVTQTAGVHAAAWKQLFDEYREKRLQRHQRAYEPFEIETDYREYVDGKPRYDGIQSFLQSRQIDLPYGTPDDPPDQETVCGLANRKNLLFRQSLEKVGVKVYDSTVRLINDLRIGGFRVAVISASKNCSMVLRAARLLDVFDAQVDGLEANRLQLKGKPAPDVFLEAARRLGVRPERAVVVEDAVAGVQAGKKGGFAFVIGVDRTGVPDRLKKHGADLVVADLAEVVAETEDTASAASTASLPSAKDRLDEIIAERPQRVAVFLDYDGTLTPIVSRPEDAILDDAMRETIRRLASECTVAVISGRGLDDVRARVGLDEIVYAGSHGFEIVGPGGLREENREAKASLEDLARAEAALEEKLAAIPGAQLERKKYSLAIHYRNVPEARVAEVDRAVEEVAQRHARLRRSGGKKVHELQPNIDWHKGRAVLWLLEALGLEQGDVLPMYLGDDLTDEDAFQALRGRGVGIVVRDRDEPRPTAARYALESPREVGEFLGLLIDHAKKATL